MEINAIGHDTYKGVSSWHFMGSVLWEDGKETQDHELSPQVVCYDHENPEAESEYMVVSKALSDYLLKAGKWHDQKTAKDGRVYSWTPNEKTGKEDL